MTIYNSKFEQAQQAVKTLTERPDNATLLKLYVSYTSKQPKEMQQVSLLK
ncbi:hypothetical protein GCM10009007_00810 [Formosimonas limnophila]|uniref:Uncharacterized protein n=2 Tax=Formosimonas limnophila TaxID=1384487 RepID=A0A8J3CJF6_9BURK|nr:hypothetical protein GCM10009007_00810 [Formosimonas limnophila]